MQEGFCWFAKHWKRMFQMLEIGEKKIVELFN